MLPWPTIHSVGTSILVLILAPGAPTQGSGRSDWDPANLTRGTSGAMGPASGTRTSAPGNALAGTGRSLLGVDVSAVELIEIDATTGNGTPIGPVGDGVIAGLAYDPNNQILYGTSTLNNVLLTIDPQSGATTVIGSFSVSLMHGLGYDSNNDVLYGITNQSGTGGNALWRLDVTDGSESFVGNHNQLGLSGLAFDAATDTMYASDIFSKELFTIDLSTGAVTLVGGFGQGVQIGCGLEFDATLGLFATDNMASSGVDDELFSIDTSNGTATLVGPINAGNVLGLAFVGDALGSKYCTANANSTGSPADIAASGSASSGAGALTLTSAPVPNQNGVFFHGTSQSQVSFGNGFLCATGGLARGSVVAASSNTATYTYDNSGPKRDLSAYIGSTRNFQHWTRDPMGGGALHNTSNAIAIGILP